MATEATIQYMIEPMLLNYCEFFWVAFYSIVFGPSVTLQKRVTHVEINLSFTYGNSLALLPRPHSLLHRKHRQPQKYFSFIRPLFYEMPLGIPLPLGETKKYHQKVTGGR